MTQFVKGMIIKMSGLAVKKENGVFEVNSTWEKDCSVYKLKKDGTRIKKGLDIFSYKKIEKYGQIITLDQIPAAISEINKQLKEVKENEIVVSYVSTDKKEYVNKSYIRVIQPIHTTSSIYSIPRNTVFQLSINEKWNNVTWERIGKRGEIITSGDKSLMSWKSVTMEKLINEGFIEIVERVETVRKDIDQTTPEQNETVEPIEVATATETIETVETTQEELTVIAEQQEEVTDVITEAVQDDQIEVITEPTGISYKLNDEKNGVEIYFDSKPSEEVRNLLKGNGFRWGKYNKCWYAKQSEETLSLAKQLAGEEGQNINNSDTSKEHDYNNQLTPEQQETLSTRLEKEHVKPIRLFKHDNNSILLECENLNISDEERKPFYFIIQTSGNEHGKGYDYPLNEYNLIHTFGETVSKTPITAGSESNISYPEVDIDDCTDEKYNISQQLQDREHDSFWVMRKTKRDHNKELQELFIGYTDRVKAVLSMTDNSYYIYKIKSALQRFKKNYHTAYVKYLTHKANNPSWVTTGRGGMNVSKYNKAMNRQDSLMMEVANLPKEFETELNRYKNKIRKDKEEVLKTQLREELKQPLPELTFKTVTKDFDIYGRGTTVKTRFYECEAYSIAKVWGAFRVFVTATGKEIYSTKSNGTLQDAKAYVQLLIKKERELQAV